MRIEKKATYYGYDLVINHVLHKRCLDCEKWYEFDGEMGYCKRCLSKFKQNLSHSNIQAPFNQQK
jgi:predicted amidophosphoribosyltransferase